ncbi:MAG: transposase [Bdellovibrionales bacterium]|nr:transposase [Bdellovibrionales bacterium]
MIIWNIFSDYLFYLSKVFEIEIHSFVLMHNHYHLLVSAPLQNLSVAFMNFNREVSRELNRNGNRINRTFSGFII